MLKDSFQEKIWHDKYQYKGETFEEFCKRIAGNIFYDNENLRDKLYNYIYNGYVIFGGRINSNIGVEEQGLTLFNCFIESVGENPDSLEGIMDMVSRYITTLKTEGGVGFCANFLRPANTLIRKIGVTTPGSIKFLELFDKASEIITAGSVSGANSFQGQPFKKSIRKGATMVTMSISHPDIEEFITAKSIPNRLTKMNMSVLVSDAFMYAVENDLDWTLWFPDINYEKYESEWFGDMEDWAAKGYPTVVYKTVKAKYLWDLLLQNTYNRNEPGVLFIDNARKMDNLWYLERSSILSSNPCAEIMGVTGQVKIGDDWKNMGDICCLGSVNVVKFYDPVTEVFDTDHFLDTVVLLVDALDRVIDVSNYPLDEYRDAALLKRKIGVGIMGVGSLMMMMNIRYGSSECVEFLNGMLYEFMNCLYKTSAILAKEKGVFPLYDEKIFEGGYIKNSGNLSEDTLGLIKEYGLRNSALAAIAPNGTGSILAGNVSGGLEPVFAKEFTRWNRVEGQEKKFDYPDISKGEWYETDYFKEESVAGDVMLLSTDGEYRVDKNNGLCKRNVIKDYGYKVAEEHGFENVAGATELNIEEHLKVLSTFAKYVDLSCSKTINLPNEITFEEFKELYGRIHGFGIKGCTTYRAGTMVGILETSKKEEKAKTVKEEQQEFLDAFKDHKNNVVIDQVSLPTEYPSRGYILRSEGKKFYLHVAFKDKDKTKPFALFVNTNAREDNVSTFNALEKLAELAKSMGLNGELLEEVQRKYAYQKNPVKICRMLGFLLRHNVDVFYIVKTLDSVEDATAGSFVHRIKKFLAQFIIEVDAPHLCPECNGKALIFKEGCYICNSCGYSRC